MAAGSTTGFAERYNTWLEPCFSHHGTMTVLLHAKIDKNTTEVIAERLRRVSKAEHARSSPSLDRRLHHHGLRRQRRGGEALANVAPGAAAGSSKSGLYYGRHELCRRWQVGYPAGLHLVPRSAIVVR